VHEPLEPKLQVGGPDATQFIPHHTGLQIKTSLADPVLDETLEEVGVHAERDVRQHPPWRPVVNGANLQGVLEGVKLPRFGGQYRTRLQGVDWIFGLS